VINPQEEHILCARNPPVCGFSLSLQRSSRRVKSTINTPKEILVAFIRTTLPGKFCNDLHVSTLAEWIESCKIAANGMADRSLAEKPKMGELQMDWLRSEDLKEEKNVTAPSCHDSTYGPVSYFGVADRARRNIVDMRRLSVEHPVLSAWDHFVAADVLVRDEPEEEEEEEEDDDSSEDEDDNGDGYSE